MAHLENRNFIFKFFPGFEASLPKLKEIGGNYYSSLHHHTSYTILLFRFLFDKNLSVFSRMARANRGKTKLNDYGVYNVETSKVLLKEMQ